MMLSLAISHASLPRHVGKIYYLELTSHSLCYYANHYTVLASGFLIVYNQEDYDFWTFCLLSGYFKFKNKLDNETNSISYWDNTF